MYVYSINVTLIYLNKEDYKYHIAIQVTKRIVMKGGWKNWKWRTYKDAFLNGAYFVPSGYGTCAPYYSSFQSFSAASASLVPALTLHAGPLICIVGEAC